MGSYHEMSPSVQTDQSCFYIHLPCFMSTLRTSDTYVGPLIARAYWHTQCARVYWHTQCARAYWHTQCARAYWHTQCAVIERQVEVTPRAGWVCGMTRISQSTGLWRTVTAVSVYSSNKRLYSVNETCWTELGKHRTFFIYFLFFNLMFMVFIISCCGVHSAKSEGL